jgi:hypothetical protein
MKKSQMSQMSHPDLDLTVSPTCQCRFGGGASPAGTTSCLTAGGAQRNPWSGDLDLTVSPTCQCRFGGDLTASIRPFLFKETALQKDFAFPFLRKWLFREISPFPF